MNRQLTFLALIVTCICATHGQFQKMFGQQTVLDGQKGHGDGKILIKSELDIQITVSYYLLYFEQSRYNKGTGRVS